MRINQPRRIDRGTAERLLDGRPLDPAAEHDALVNLLAAVAAPPGEGELAGEGAAVAAFREARLGSVRQPRRGPMTTTKRVKLLGAKAIAAAVATTAVCGVALAAGTGLLPGGRGSGTSASHNTSPAADASTARPTDSGSPSGKTPGGGHGTGRPGTIGLCRAYSAADKTDRGKILASPPFTALVREAGGKAKVAAYCAKVLLNKEQGDKKAVPTPSRTPAAGQTNGAGQGQIHGTPGKRPRSSPESAGVAPDRAPDRTASGHASGSG